MKWDFRNTDGDDLITAVEEPACMQRVMDFWKMFKWKEFLKYCLKFNHF